MLAVFVAVECVDYAACAVVGIVCLLNAVFRVFGFGGVEHEHTVVKIGSLIHEFASKSEFYHFPNLPDVDNVLEKIAFLAAGGQHHKFGKGVAVEVSVGL